MKSVGILYHPKKPEAVSLAQNLLELLPRWEVTPWICSAWEGDKVRAEVPYTNLMICVGGDGTILRAARAIVPHNVPILGVNLGRLGFMTELTAAEAPDHLKFFLSGHGHIDERAMLRVDFLPGRRTDDQFHARMAVAGDALNDVYLGRGRTVRAVYTDVFIDEHKLTTYKGDGVLVSSATGSTGYSLANGGPVLHPSSKDFLLLPIAPHLSSNRALVLPAATRLELEIRTDHEAVMSIDGQVEVPVLSGDKITVSLSPNQTRFIRRHDLKRFYATLESKLKGHESADSRKSQN